VPDRPPLVIVLDRLIGRHGLCPSAALGVLSRAAARKDTTVEDLVRRIAGGGRSPLDERRDEVAHLRIAVQTRDIIGQAKGILMERHAIGADEAFDRLVTMSQSSNVKLREVCEHLVELRSSEGLPRPDIDVRLV
jgi:hypothetical protein